MQKDILYEIYQKYLHDCLIGDLSLDQLVHNVVAEYIYYLYQQGFVPSCIEDTLEIDLTEEVLEMYRKTTYGYVSFSTTAK